MRRLYFILFFIMLVCIGCEWHLRTEEAPSVTNVVVERYDRIESLFLTTGDVAALGQMNTAFPRQTRTLIENMLQLGHVNDSDINSKFYRYFQDTTLQMLITEVDRQYADLSDINEELTEAFARLQQLLPNIEIPQAYAQIGSLNQSIVVDDGLLGISLDKYLGSDYPLYLRYGYSERQRQTMTRSFIVPDCLGFYLLSLYPLSVGHKPLKKERDHRMGAIQYIVNKAMDREVFDNEYVDWAEHQILQAHLTLEQLLQ